MLIDPASWGLLDPILEALLEIGVLEDHEDHLDLVESQVVYLQKSHRLQVDAYIKKGKLTPEDPEWHMALQDHYHWIDFLLPRFLRGPFLVFLYAVYESMVTEAADVMRDRVSESRRLAEYGAKNLGFLQRAAKYYREVLAFDLCLDPTTWERLDALCELRNALAHANGRLDILQAKKNLIKHLWLK